MDELSYHYDPFTNRLTHVDDAVDGDNYDVDIDDQDPNNYTYDRTGRLIGDVAEGLTIKWTGFNKPDTIFFRDEAGNPTKMMTFKYGPDLNRVAKTVAYGDTLSETTYYVGDDIYKLTRSVSNPPVIWLLLNMSG